MYGYVDCNGDGWRDLPRKAASDACKPFTVIEYASAPDGQQQPLDENWKKNMDAIGINMQFRQREVARPAQGLEGRQAADVGPGLERRGARTPTRSS